MDEQRANRIEAKLDKIADDIGKIEVTQARQADSLEYHIKRTDTLEDMVKPLWSFLNAVSIIMKVIGVLALLAGIGESIAILLDYLDKR